MTLQRWTQRIAEKVMDHITVKCQRYQERLGRVEQVEQVEHRVQMLLGIFSAKGVLPLEFKPAHSVGDLLTQHLDELEQEAERKGGCRRRSPTSLPRSIRPLPHSQQPPRSAGTVQASEDMRSRTTIRRQTKKVAVLKIRQTI